MAKLSVAALKAAKHTRQLTIATAFDTFTAMACERAGIDIILTWPQITGTLEELRIMLKCVTAGAPNTMIGAGIPALPGYTSVSEATRCAFEAMSLGAGLIYASGMELSKFEALARQRIPCVGHVGLIPFHATWTGGLRAVGKTADEALEVYQRAKEFQDIGCVAVEMECVPERAAALIAEKLDILVFSMGSGPHCDGQFLFSCDMLGTGAGRIPRHAKPYANLMDSAVNALSKFREEVTSGAFPDEKRTIRMADDAFERFERALDQR